MNYLKEQTDGEAMINSIQNGDHSLPVIAQVSLAGTTPNAPPTLKDPKFWTAEEKKNRKIDRLARSLLIQGLPNDIYSLIDSNDTAKDLWDALERQMRGSEYGEQDRKAAILYEYETFKATEGELLLDTYIRYLQVINDLKKQNKNLMDINIDALYNILKQDQGDVNEAMGHKKKAVMVTSDPLVDDEDISDLKKITALLAKAFNRKNYYVKPTNNNLRTSSASSSANKKPEYVKSEKKTEDKKVDEKKRDMSKVKCYNCKKNGHFAKDYMKAKDQAWMESSSDSDQEISANMVFMAKMEKVLSDSEESSSSAEETIAEVSYYTFDSESESEYETSEYYDNSTNYGVFVDNDDDQEIFHDAIESASENFNENHIVSQTDHDESEVDHNDSEENDHLVDKLIKKFNQKIAKCQKRIKKANQQSKDVACHIVMVVSSFGLRLMWKEIDEQEILFDKMSRQLIEMNNNVLRLQENFFEKEAKISELEECVRNKDLDIEKYLDTLSSVRRPKHSGVIWKKKGSSNTSNVDLSSVSHSKLNKDVTRYSRKDLLSCNNSHHVDTRSAYACNDAMNVSCNSRLYASCDVNDLFVFDDVSIRKSQVSKMPFRKNPRDSLNVHSRRNSNKSLPKTVFRWLPKMQPLAELVAKWIPKIIHICLWIIDSGCSKHITRNRALLTNFVEKFLGMVRFGNNDFAVIAGYGDVVIGSMTIKKVYYVEDLLTGDHSSNLYTIALNEITSNSSAYLLAKASSSQSWLWYQRLSHLNFATINNLVKNNLVRGLPKMKFKKDHLCSAYEQGKIHRKHHKSKTAFASNKPLYLLHMDLCDPMCVESINGKRYMLVVVNDYSRYTWRVRTDNGVEFKNKTLAKFFDEVGISQQFSAARTPQQNGVVERRNRTLARGKLKAKGDISVCMDIQRIAVIQESSSSSLNDDVQQSLEEVMVSPTNTQSVSNNMVPNVNEASSSHNVFNERLEDAYFDAIECFVTRGQLSNSCLFACLLSSIEPANVAEALKDADWVSAMQDELDQFARLKV
ncbi:retrovirus-related pol polyprotein from transposon TNT 1-94 [Tanacetum coccineum]